MPTAENADLTEILRFVFGLSGFLLTSNCIYATTRDYLAIRSDMAADPLAHQERLIVAGNWVIAAAMRALLSVMLAFSGWLLLTLPQSSIVPTPEGLAIYWGWDVLAILTNVQALLARWDRHRIRGLRR